MSSVDVPQPLWETNEKHSLENEKNLAATRAGQARVNSVSLPSHSAHSFSSKRILVIILPAKPAKPNPGDNAMSESIEPQPEHVDAAAEELDNILFVAQKMTVASSEKRQILFKLTKIPVDNLLELNRRHFDDSEAIHGRIALLAKALVTLRNLGGGAIHEDRSDGWGNCPHCETRIERFQPQEDPRPEDPWVVFCPACREVTARALERLAAPDVGFGTSER